MILEIPLVFQGETQWVKAELQLRTAAMDYWANLDHQLRYKKEDSRTYAAAIDQELKKCAEIVEYLGLDYAGNQKTNRKYLAENI